MRCPKCGFMETRVLETRTAGEGRIIRRRRECPECMARFTTYERIEDRPVLWIVKKSGQRETFDRVKLLKGLAKACEKLPVPLEQIEEAATRIEETLREMGQGEISSLKVGSLAMDELRSIHKVAYVRFASVYREFTDISSFVEEISRLHDERNGHI